MKHLLLVLALLTLSVAQASEIKVLSISEHQMAGTNYSTQTFEFNESLGRAWVRFIASSYEGDSAFGVDKKILIPGLSFDSASQTVVLEHEGKLTTCAEYKTIGRSVFKRKSMEMAPQCKFEARWRDVTYDDGFEMKKFRKYEIFLIVE